MQGTPLGVEEVQGNRVPSPAPVVVPDPVLEPVPVELPGKLVPEEPPPGLLSTEINGGFPLLPDLPVPPVLPPVSEVPVVDVVPPEP